MVAEVVFFLKWLRRIVGFYNEEQSPPNQYYNAEMAIHYALRALGEE